MWSRRVWLALGTALLTVSCTEQEPREKLPTPPLDALADSRSDPEFRHRIDGFIRKNPELARDYVEKTLASAEGEEAALAAVPGERETRVPRLWYRRGAWPGGMLLLSTLGAGAVLVALLVAFVHLFRRTGVSMDLAVRASRRRYLAHCRAVAKRREREEAAGIGGRGSSAKRLASGAPTLDNEKMRVLLTITIILAGLAALVGCQRWGPNDPARMSDNPELQMLRDSRQDGLRTRCAQCHVPTPSRPPAALDPR